MSSELQISQKEAVELLFTLEDKNKITFRDLNKKVNNNFQNSLFSLSALWYWVILVMTLVLYIASSTIIINNTVINYVRYIIGFSYIIFLPGYCTLINLYKKDDFSKIKLFTLSIGISLSLISIQGLILNYFGLIDLLPIILLDIMLVLFLSTLALRKNYLLLKKEKY